MSNQDDAYSWLIGKRVIISWTDKAHRDGADWVAFRVIDTGSDAIWLQGVASPSGSRHDGSRFSAPISEIQDIIEWREESNDHLILAADQMLAALELAKQFGDENAMRAIDPDGWDAINAAISSAKGAA
jgi:hypothetical protein